MNAEYPPIGIYRFLKPILFLLPPEKAHALSLHALHWSGKVPPLPSLIHSLCAPTQQSHSFLGHTLSNRIGMAAGYDKNAWALDGLSAMGFGHIEVGTITPKPQQGNPSPRVHRLPREYALVNRLGFPNEGVEVISSRIAAYRKRVLSAQQQHSPLLGINIGKNKDTPNESAYADYVYCFEHLVDYADYIAINISSPNTPYLRELQQREALEKLLTPLLNARAKRNIHIPFFVKLAPDLLSEERMHTLNSLVELGIEGAILSNTQKIHEPFEGGKSGLPIRESTLSIIKESKKECPKLHIIASGGIGLDGDVEEFCRAGADLVQIWTALVYRGPRLLRRL